jgi:4-hydroxyphenylpyruvate dioxygenase
VFLKPRALVPGIDISVKQSLELPNLSYSILPAGGRNKGETLERNSTMRSGTTPEVHGIHHVEMYVSNYKQAAHFYRSTLGLMPAAQWETANAAGHTSFLLSRENIQLVLSSPTEASGPVSDDIYRHGEGVKDVALSVTGVDQLFAAAVEQGAEPIASPSSANGPWGRFRTACIGTCGNLVHSLMEPVEPNPKPQEGRTSPIPRTPLFDSFLAGVDHVALAVDLGQLERWINFYISALGFQKTYQQAVMTEYSGMNSMVVQTPNGAVRFPIMEAAKGKKKSQIETYVSAHQGAGAQHLAFLSDDIIASVSAMAEAGVEFLPTPDTYYEVLQQRVGNHGLDPTLIKHLGILVDRDSDGYLYQIFTKPIGSRPTLFLEIIQRRGAQGFGAGNIKALYEAVERTQVAAHG